MLAMREKDQQERAQLDAIRAEMKGRPYTYDQSGKVMPVAELDAKHLPAAAITPRFRAGTAASVEARARPKKADAGRFLAIVCIQHFVLSCASATRLCAAAFVARASCNHLNCYISHDNPFVSLQTLHRLQRLHRVTTRQVQRRCGASTRRHRQTLWSDPARLSHRLWTP